MSLLSSKRVFVSAGEYSGSLYIASVIEILKKERPNLVFEGIGGLEMEQVGVKILYNSSDWGSIGIVEALKRWRLILVNFEIQRYLSQNPPDLLILSDYPGFNMRLAALAKERKVPCIYIFPPRKFATSSDSVLEAAKTIQRVAAEFEPTYQLYRQAGARVDFVGHPMLDVLPLEEEAEIRTRMNLSVEKKVILLMPGSRTQEICLLLPLYEELVVSLCKKRKNLRFHLLGACNLSSQSGVVSRMEKFCKRLAEEGAEIELYWKDRFSHMRIADYALVASGTATLELACYQVPMSICYKVTSMTEVLAKCFTRLPKYVGLPNLLAGREIVPEFIQKNARADLVEKEIFRTLFHPQRIQAIREDLLAVKAKLGEPGAVKRLKNLILEELYHSESGFHQVP